MAFSPQRIERVAVRVVLFDCDGSTLLLSTRDLSNAEFPQSWEVPGGGLVPGEAPLAGAVREILEETGIRLHPGSLNGPLWRRNVIYAYRGERRLQHETIFTAKIEHRAPPIYTAGREAFELEDHLTSRWWTIDEILASAALFYPRSLPAHIAALAAGRPVDEPLEIWDETSRQP
jgi:8-oxo-dGTP pyrophosphatase MutT (NUDIX family)